MVGKFLRQWNLFRKKYYIQVIVLSLWVLGLFLITYFMKYTESYFSLIIQGFLPENRNWTFYAGVGLIIISLVVLTLGPMDLEYETQRKYIKHLPELKSQINSYIQASDLSSARQMIQENLEKIHSYAYEEVEFFDNALKNIDKNQFFNSRLELADLALIEKNYPVLHWELGKLTGFVTMEQNNLSKPSLDKYSRLYHLGQELYHTDRSNF
jgi:hypothetical protein